MFFLGNNSLTISREYIKFSELVLNISHNSLNDTVVSVLHIYIVLQ